MKIVKVYLKSGSVATIKTNADLDDVYSTSNIFELMPEVRGYLPDEVALLTVEDEQDDNR